MAKTRKRESEVRTISHNNNEQHDQCDTQRENRPPDFDTVLEDVGEFGWSQRLHLAVLCGANWSRGVFIMAIMFLGKTPDFHCKDRPAAGDDDPCSLKPSCQKFVYDNPDNFTSAVSEWDLVCEDKEYAGFMQSALMFGMLLGNFFLAPLVDKYGRWWIMVLSSVICLFGHTGSSFSLTYNQFIFTRFAVGVGLGGGLSNSVWITENIHSRWRSFFSLLHSSSNAIGGMMLAALAFYLRDWRDLTFYSGCILIPFIFLCWYVPESPRWLLSEGRLADAESILLDTARINGVVVSREHIKQSLEQIKSASKSEGSDNVKSSNILDVFRTAGMRRRIFVLMFIWVTCVMVYYSLTIGATNLEGNMYINVAASGLTELPTTLIIEYLCKRYGRRNSTIGCTLIGAMGCIVFILLPLQPDGDLTQYHTWSVLAGKTGISASFSLIYVYTGELLPTVVRGSAFAICTTIGRLGGIAGPVISSMVFVFMLANLIIRNQYQRYTLNEQLSSPQYDTSFTKIDWILFKGDNFAYPLYGAMCLIACVLCLDLPETLNKPLPDSIDDIERDYYGDDTKKRK